VRRSKHGPASVEYQGRSGRGGGAAWEPGGAGRYNDGGGGKTMNKQLIAILAGASLLGGEAVGEKIDKFDLRWVAAEPHNHVDIPEEFVIDVSSPISASGQAFALRAILKKDGCSDVRFEFYRNSYFDFAMVEDGIPTGVFWIGLTPQQAITGALPHTTLRGAWQRCLAKRFPEYTVTALEEGLPGFRTPDDPAL
jgi:hypothetical protein